MAGLNRPPSQVKQGRNGCSCPAQGRLMGRAQRLMDPRHSRFVHRQDWSGRSGTPAICALAHKAWVCPHLCPCCPSGPGSCPPGSPRPTHRARVQMFKAGKYKPLGAWPMWKRRYPWHAHEQAGDSRESHSQGLGLGRQPLLHALTLLEAAQPSM